ncbi:MAG: hypothetical protein R2799_09030 [Crocinitomicaceae bacterium]
MNKEQEEIIDSNSEMESKTNWTAWYIGVLGFLLIQIVVYYLITKSY